MVRFSNGWDHLKTGPLEIRASKFRISNGHGKRDDTFNKIFKTKTFFLQITPAHDPNDYECGKRHNLPFVTIFTDDGIISDGCGKFSVSFLFYICLSVFRNLSVCLSTSVSLSICLSILSLCLLIFHLSCSNERTMLFYLVSALLRDYSLCWDR